mmetsp:Transcript_49503/g.108113  ORF Transcript_49503/g.108113 Transcript_49503/m.108113 type:complete len:86 (+) Transcript_49503:238-495(+)
MYGLTEAQFWDQLRRRGVQVYVQHKVLEQRDLVLDLVGKGAVIYVCGDAGGMAPAVASAFAEILGGDEVQKLREAQRYQEDVWAN